jgi:hypothetical protein
MKRRIPYFKFPSWLSYLCGEAPGNAINSATSGDTIRINSASDAVDPILTGTKGTCVLSSFALNHVLKQFGLSSYPLRVECSVHHRMPTHGTEKPLRRECGTVILPSPSKPIGFAIPHLAKCENPSVCLMAFRLPPTW